MTIDNVDDIIRKANKLESHVSAVLGGRGAFARADWAQIKTIPENIEAVNTCKSFDPKTMNLFLWGKCGRGKTLLAKAIARQWMFNGMEADIWTPRHIAWHLAAKENGKKSMRWFHQHFSDVDIFVLNDISSGKMDTDVFFLLCDILETRGDIGKGGLIITSNFNLETLAGILGDDRLPSRIQMCKEVEVRGPDWRRQ